MHPQDSLTDFHIHLHFILIMLCTYVLKDDDFSLNLEYSIIKTSLLRPKLNLQDQVVPSGKQLSVVSDILLRILSKTGYLGAKASFFKPFGKSLFSLLSSVQTLFSCAVGQGLS